MNVETLINELKITSAEWEKFVSMNKDIPEDLAPYGYPQFSKIEMGLFLGGFSETLSAYSLLIANNTDPYLKRSIQSLQNVVNNLVTNRSSLKNNPGGVIAAIIQGVESVRSTLYSAGLGTYIGKIDLAQLPSPIVINQVSSAVENTKKNLTASQEDKKQIENIKLSIDAIKQQIEPSKNLIDVHLKDSNTKLQQIEENRAKVQAFASDYSNLRKQNDELVNLIKNYEKSVEGLRQEHENQSQKVKSTLEAAERVGLAKSFSSRKEELKQQTKGWLLLLISSLIGLLVVGILIIHPAVNHLNGTERLIALLTEIPLTAPFIWLAWYAATQLGYIIRVSEDYSFKVASALALDGYKREATSVDKELEKRLLDGAISNFSENPIRIYGKKDVNGSPWQEFSKHPEVRDKLKALFDTVLSMKKPF